MILLILLLLIEQDHISQREAGALGFRFQGATGKLAVFCYGTMGYF